MSGTGEPLLQVRNLRKHYPITKGVLSKEVGRVRAVDGIDFDVRRGETVGIVGESGCGKSTAATSLLRLEEPTLYDPDTLERVDADVVPRGMGASIKKRLGMTADLDGDDVTEEERELLLNDRTRILFDGEDIVEYDKQQLKRFRRRAQMIFQDPKSTFDPRMSIGDSLEEPLRVHGMSDRGRRREIVADLLERVGLNAEDVERFPHEFSGGQKQRIALARALVVNPDLIVADEPVSALDVSIQANILRLMEDLQDEFGLSILFISHDMGVVQEVCDRVAVMYLGEIVEMGPTEELFEDPKHPYTRALLSSIPVPNPRQRGLGTELIGDVPSASAPPQGCRFHTRCPEVIQPEGYDLDQDHWKHVMHFREKVRRRQVDLEAIEEALELQDEDGASAEVGADELEAELRAEFDLPEQLSDPGADQVLDDAIEYAAAGDMEQATNVMSEAFSTVCERETPKLTEIEPDHQAACHLNDGTRTEPVPGAGEAAPPQESD